MNRDQIRQALRPVFHVFYDYELTGDCSIKPYNEDEQNIYVDMLNACDEMPENRVAFYDEKDNLIVICLKESSSWFYCVDCGENVNDDKFSHHNSGGDAVCVDCKSKESETMTTTKDRIKLGVAIEKKRFEQEQCKIENNITALESYIASMNCAIEKAKKGSKSEQSYFNEKLNKMSNRLGFVLIPVEVYNDFCKE